MSIHGFEGETVASGSEPTETPRRAMFTPFKVASGPDGTVDLSKVRVTRGKYLDTGESFEIVDDFSKSADAHRILRAGWLGETEFRDSTELVEENPCEQKKLVSWADMEDDEPTTDLFPKPANSLNILTVREVHSRVSFPLGSFSGAGGRGVASLDRNRHESPYTHAVIHALSSDMQVHPTVCVGECQMNTDRYDRPYQTGSQACTKAEVASDRQSDGRGDTATGGMTEMLRSPRTRVAQGETARNCGGFLLRV